MQAIGGQASTVRRQIGEKAIRALIAIVGLLLIRGICSFLPMLKHASPVYHRSWVSLVPGGAIGAEVPSAVRDAWQKALERDPQARLATDALRRAFAQSGNSPETSPSPEALAALNQWEEAALLPTLQGKYGSELADATIKSMVAQHWAIFPLTIVNAVIDTIIFLVLIGFGGEVRRAVRGAYPRFPDFGQICFLAIVTLTVTLAYNSYQGLVYPLLDPGDEPMYGWAFLVLGLAPLIGVVVLVARNMDTISALAFRSAQAATGTLRCAGCGQSLESGAKFCPFCGAATPAPVVANVAARRFCPACGAENTAVARFCKGCGKTFQL